MSIVGDLLKGLFKSSKEVTEEAVEQTVKTVAKETTEQAVKVGDKIAKEAANQLAKEQGKKEGRKTVGRFLLKKAGEHKVITAGAIILGDKATGSNISDFLGDLFFDPLGKGDVAAQLKKQGFGERAVVSFVMSGKGTIIMTAEEEGKESKTWDTGLEERKNGTFNRMFDSATDYGTAAALEKGLKAAGVDPESDVGKSIVGNAGNITAILTAIAGASLANKWTGFGDGIKELYKGVKEIGGIAKDLTSGTLGWAWWGTKVVLGVAAVAGITCVTLGKGETCQKIKDWFFECLGQKPGHNRAVEMNPPLRDPYPGRAPANEYPTTIYLNKEHGKSAPTEHTRSSEGVEVKEKDAGDNRVERQIQDLGKKIGTNPENKTSGDSVTPGYESAEKENVTRERR